LTGTWPVVDFSDWLHVAAPVVAVFILLRDCADPDDEDDDEDEDEDE
jgi:hypothetical protein